MKTHVRTLQLSLFACLLLLCSSAWATHISGGYIAYKWLQGNDYEITVGVFYDGIDGVPAPNLVRLSISGVQSQAIDIAQTSLVNILKGSYRSIAIYETQFTFPEVSFFGGVRYKLGVLIENRSGGIMNMASPSDQVPFYIETEIYVNSFLGINSSAAPTDTVASVSGKVNQLLTADLSSVDPDGDSLVYRLVTPKQNNSIGVTGYRSPETLCNGCTFTLNAQTGQLIWDQPTLQGSYTIAVMVEEWRKIPGTSRSLRMGYTIKDILLVISD